MEKDIDKISQLLRQEFPLIQIEQLKTVHPTDDDGLWFIRWPNKKGEVQIESVNGNCPFIIESTKFNKSLQGKTVEDVVAKTRSIHSEFFLD